jgi:hypothetical protein
LLRCWASPRTIETPLKALSAHGTGTNENSESADANMGILVVEFHGVAFVDRVLVEAFFSGMVKKHCYVFILILFFH